MTFQAGDPGHVSVHNSVAASLASLAAADTSEAAARASGDTAAIAAAAAAAAAAYAPILTATAIKTTSYTAAAGDFVPVSTAGGAVTVTLPTAPANGSRVAVKHIVQTGSNVVTIAAGGTDHFNTSTGPTSATLTLLNQAVQMQYAGGVWYVVADDLPLSQLDARFLTPAAASGALVSVGQTNVDVHGKYAGDLAAAVAAEGAGKRYLLADSTHTLTAALPLGTGTVFEGVGRSATLITQANGSNLDALVKSTGYDGLTGGNTSGGVQQSSLRRVIFDGNKANNTSTVGIKHYGALQVWEDIVVRNCPGDGIRSEWSNSAVFTDGVQGMHRNVVSHDNGGNGITWSGPHDSLWVGGEIFKNGAKGIHVNTPNAAILTAIGVHVWGATHTHGWYLEGAIIAVGCQSEGASVGQVMVGSADVSWLGGKVFAAGAATPKGFLIGDATHTGPITGLNIDTRVQDCTSGAYDFTNAGSANGRIDGVIYQASGTVYVGTIPTGMLLQALTLGTVPTDPFRFPLPVDVKATNSTAFHVDGANTKFNVNSSSGKVELVNGTQLVQYSDNFSTTVLLVDATGKITKLAGATVTQTAGAGTPEGVVTAPIGSTYQRTDGGAATSFYVKESGAGNTGWVGK